MGEWKVKTDDKKKLVKVVMNGKINNYEAASAFSEWFFKILNYPRDEVLAIYDISGIDNKSLTPEITEIIKSFTDVVIPYSKKLTAVAPSFLPQSSFESKVSNEDFEKFRIFKSENEALYWLNGLAI